MGAQISFISDKKVRFPCKNLTGLATFAGKPNSAIEMRKKQNKTRKQIFGGGESAFEREEWPCLTFFGWSRDTSNQDQLASRPQIAFNQTSTFYNYKK